jgi:hypothetical protein
MNPALPKTRTLGLKAGDRNFEEMRNSLAKLKLRLGIAKKGRAG